MTACPSIGVDAATVRSALASVDCHIDAVVATSYGHLFAGPSAPLGVILTVVMTLYVALIGLRLMTGRGASLSELSPRAALLGLVLTFATAWPAYQTVVYGLLVHGPDQIAETLMGAQGGAALGFAGLLDRDLQRISEAAIALTPANEQVLTPAGMNGGLLWLSALIFLLSSVGVLVAAKVVLGVLLACGPVFVVLALFPSTRGLFEAWLRVCVGFAFAPMLAVLSGSATLLFLEPAIAALPDAMADPVPPEGPNGSVIMLFIGAIIYALLLTVTWAAAGRLVSGWRPRQITQRPATQNTQSGPTAVQGHPAPKPAGIGAQTFITQALQGPGAKIHSHGAPRGERIKIDIPATRPLFAASHTQHRSLGQTFRTRHPKQVARPQPQTADRDTP